MTGTASLARELWPEKQPGGATVSAQLHDVGSPDPSRGSRPRSTGHARAQIWKSMCHFICMHGQRVVTVAG